LPAARNKILFRRFLHGCKVLQLPASLRFIPYSPDEYVTSAAASRGFRYNDSVICVIELATPEAIRHWSLTGLREKLIKIGAKVVSHGR
jgi:hypothetical protein